MTLQAAKARLRRDTIARIRALDPIDRIRQEDELTRRVVELPGFAAAHAVLLYASAFPEEVDTSRWLSLALEQGKCLVCPRVAADRQTLELCVVNDLQTDLVTGFRSIPEPGPLCSVVTPDAIDWALIPGLAFDRLGYRLGRGAGHYDRLLPRLRADVPAFALILRSQWVDAVPREDHDQPLTGVSDSEALVLGLRPRITGNHASRP